MSILIIFTLFYSFTDASFLTPTISIKLYCFHYLMSSACYKFFCFFLICSNRNSAAFWTREKVGEYFPIFAKDHAPLLDYLKSFKILGQEKKKESISPLVVNCKFLLSSCFKKLRTLWCRYKNLIEFSMNFSRLEFSKARVFCNWTTSPYLVFVVEWDCNNSGLVVYRKWKSTQTSPSTGTTKKTKSAKN